MRLVQGKPLEYRIELWADDRSADLTGCSVSFGLLAHGNQRFLDGNSNDGTGYITIPDPSTGIVKIEIPTPLLPAGRYQAGINITWSDGSFDPIEFDPVNVYIGPAP